MEIKTAGDFLNASAREWGWKKKKNVGGKGSPCNYDTNNSQSAYHLSILVGQTSPVVRRIPPLTRNTVIAEPLAALGANGKK